jgi:hypothetical protein
MGLGFIGSQPDVEHFQSFGITIRLYSRRLHRLATPRCALTKKGSSVENIILFLRSTYTSLTEKDPSNVQPNTASRMVTAAEGLVVAAWPGIGSHPVSRVWHVWRHSFILEAILPNYFPSHTGANHDRQSHAEYFDTTIGCFNILSGMLYR